MTTGKFTDISRVIGHTNLASLDGRQQQNKDTATTLCVHVL